MHSAAIITLIYGLLVLVGGLIGHFKAQSRASLYSGLIFGVLLLLSSIALFRGSKVGGWAALLLTLTLFLFFAWRYWQTLKFFPPAAMGILSLITLIILFICLKKG